MVIPMQEEKSESESTPTFPIITQSEHKIGFEINQLKIEQASFWDVFGSHCGRFLEWLIFGDFLYSEGLENSRLSFLRVGKTNMEQMALGGLAKSDHSWKKQGGEISPFQSTKTSRISRPKILGLNRYSEL